MKPASEAKPHARLLFAQRARPFIIPANDCNDGLLRLIFDIETDGLLDTVTQVHCIVIGETDKDHVFEYGPKQITDALAHLARADTLIGHNIQSYDIPVLRKLHQWSPRSACRILDTLIAARLILPNLAHLDSEIAARTKDGAFGAIRGKYSLEAWGVRLGMAKTGVEIGDWSKWSPEIQARCVGDTILCKRLWQFLQPDGYSSTALELEHAAAAICEQITADGAPFDVAAAEQLCETWQIRRAELETQLRTQFPAAKNLNSRIQIANLLTTRGWTPEELTKKTEQPVINDEVLEALPAVYPEFTGLAEHYILGRRLGQLANGRRAWLNNVVDGRIHGGLIHIGTPHSRAKHLEPNLAQVPNPKRGSPFGLECRALFRQSGWAFVTADQSTLQDRGFFHYLAADNTFSEDLDRHWWTAVVLGLVSPQTVRDKGNQVHTLIREGSKSFRYAFLFGAGSLRAGQIIARIIRTVAVVAPDSMLAIQFWGGNKHPSDAALRRAGKRALDAFIAATPGLRELRKRLSAEHRQRGWVEGLDGRRVPTEADYKSLNRIVTASEAVICKRWLIDVHQELNQRFRYGPDGDVYIVLWIHDELIVCCSPAIAEQVGELLVRHARKAGEPYRFRLPLDAEFKIGRDWAGTPLFAEPLIEQPKAAKPINHIVPLLPNKIEQLTAFIREREAVRVRKEAGQPPPWTDNSILAAGHFCNVHRENDRGTRWITENWRDPHRDEPDLWFAIVIARCINEPAALAELGYPVPFDPENFCNVLEARQVRGEKVYRTAAYKPPLPERKGISITRFLAEDVLGPLWRDRERMRPHAAETLHAYSDRLRKCHRIGPFLAGQIIADLKGAEPLSATADWWTFANPGPGSERGLNRICNRWIDTPWPESIWHATLLQLGAAIAEQLATTDIARLDAQNLQNCLCEFDKYERAREKGNRPTRKYRTSPSKGRSRKTSKPIDVAYIPQVVAEIPRAKVYVDDF